MCLIVFAIDSHPRYPFVLAANRDELYARPTEPLHEWASAPEARAPQVIAGRDLEAGGTWLGITRTRRFAAITNVREGVQREPMQRSRGELTRDFLLGTQSAAEYAAQVYRDGAHYAGFNLLLGDFFPDGSASIYYCSNRGEIPRALGTGIYGLSNDSLDTPWPKVVGAKAELRELLNHEPSPAALLRILADTRKPLDAELPDTGVGLELERRFSTRFIASDEYGTRASTALTIDKSGAVEISEQNFGNHGTPIGTLITQRWSDHR